MKFYTIKLPKFLGGIVRAMLNAFKRIRKKHHSLVLFLF
ncbi:stage V sporulation protein SpoVM [Geobacillus sp. 44B]|nr:stage V sporulation protein SpoVM [Geobacillus sp. 44B]